MYRHVHIVFFRFPFVTLADVILRFLIAFRHIPISISIHLATPSLLSIRVDMHSSPVSGYHHPILSAVLFIICPPRKTGPSKSPNPSRMERAQCRQLAIPTQVTLTSTTANAAATLTPLLSQPCSHSSSATTTLSPPSMGGLSARLQFAGRQKDGTKVTPAAMPRDVMQGMIIPPIMTQLPNRNFFVRQFPCIYSLFSTNELCLLSSSPALLIVGDRIRRLLGFSCE